nr:MAG TPA: hypothetical protein [Crassvirales sp.]
MLKIVIMVILANIICIFAMSPIQLEEHIIK